MKLHEFLGGVHAAYRPRTYLEIGIRTGRSLELSRTSTIAVDPAFKIKSEIHCDLQVVKATSDDFFARHDALGHFRGERIDLAFVDGLHLFEFALRDFMNVERYAHWASVIVLDDVLPRTGAEAARERGGMAVWTGDVFNVAEVLTTYRPDLLLLPVDTDPTGVLVILGADPDNRALADHYGEIVAEYVHPDPQQVPDGVLRRETAIDPASILASDLWTDLRNSRDSGLARETAWEGVRRTVESAARPARRRELTPGPEAIAATGRARSRPATTISRRAVAAVRRRLRPVGRRLRAPGARQAIRRR